MLSAPPPATAGPPGLQQNTQMLARPKGGLGPGLGNAMVGNQLQNPNIAMLLRALMAGKGR